MKNLKAKQKAKGVKELSAQEAEKVTGGVWNNPEERQRFPGGHPGCVTLAYNEEELTNPGGNFGN